MTKKESCTINFNLPEIYEIQSYIEEIEKDPLPYEEKNFDTRIGVIDFIEFQVISQIETLLLKTIQPAQLILLKYRAEKVIAELEEIDINLFQKLQANIRTGGYKGKEFKTLINEYIDCNLDDNKHQEEPGYDNLDVFINGLSPFQAMPEQTKDLEPEMVYYQKTSARVVFELVEKAHFMKEDVFFDLGAGLGQAAILVNLLAGITVKGVEFEPAYCNFARDCAAGLNLPNVTFINVDARKADYSEGTVFFMFTPFKGEIMEEVLEVLRKESLKRKIKIITYGPCTAQVALQSWLHSAFSKDDNIYKLDIFTSL
ncbi:class I SAM-dependent methyltransferase [Mucilaginibacter sp. OK098]|uniref:class I SAM-dependent methyltransferase n=1 Tax=Mucilaginibacter sp. OK098 TaxID=1855297 RepID=UPI00091AB862|nr:class I SAM-dependent methyltransferase [Mucilaginibacter sp. OK098]SHM80774.1 Histone methylation protein DOT1 [Mucilaginibacter sp. OK098]